MLLLLREMREKLEFGPLGKVGGFGHWIISRRIRWAIMMLSWSLF